MVAGLLMLHWALLLPLWLLANTVGLVWWIGGSTVRLFKREGERTPGWRRMRRRWPTWTCPECGARRPDKPLALRRALHRTAHFLAKI